MNADQTLFERWIARPRRPVVTAVLAVTLLALVPVAAAVDGTFDIFLHGGMWRLLIYPAIITYILFVAPKLGETDRAVSGAFLRLLPGGAEAFDDLKRTVPSPRPIQEALVFGIGSLLGGLFMRLANPVAIRGWLDGVWIVEACLMYGLLFWAVYLSLVNTRQVAALHRQPLLIDPLDISDFEPIGRQGLLLALTFVGGITLSVLFAGLQIESLRMVEFWLAYIPPALIPLVVFFVNMLPTHRVISTARERELESVRLKFAQSSRALARGIEAGQDTLRQSQQVLALAAYERQLERARTWPYNTGMLRTLFFSVLVPAGTFLARVLGGPDLP